MAGETLVNVKADTIEEFLKNAQPRSGGQRRDRRDHLRDYAESQLRGQKFKKITSA